MPTSPITARVYEAASPSTLIAALPKSSARAWVDTLNEPGEGRLKLHENDPVFDTHPKEELLAYGNIVRLALNDTDRFAFVIAKRDPPPVTEEEAGARYWSISGPGVLALLARANVRTEGEVIGSHARQRRFDFTALAYDDSTWIAATEIQPQGSTTADERRWYSLPAEWPDPDAFWIWSRAKDNVYPAGKMPPGTCYFRKDFTLADATDVALFATCDNQFKLFLDGEQALEGGEWQQTYRVNVTLPAGDHQIAVEGTNTPTAAISAAAPAGPAGLLVALIETDEVGTLTTNIIVESDSSWVCLDYPVTVPGMTVGKILRLLIEQAQDRGGLPGITLTFTDDDDSHSVPWPDEPDIALDIGSSYLDVIRTFVEQFVDVEMTTDLELNVYDKGTLGSDLTGSVTLQVGVDFEEFVPSGQGQLVNALLVRDTTGGLTIREDTVSLSAGAPRIEGYVEMALAPNQQRAEEMGDEILVEFARPSIEGNAKVKAGSGPYVDWNPGDMVLAPGDAGLVDTNIISLAISEDEETGWPIYSIEVTQDDDDAAS